MGKIRVDLVLCQVRWKFFSTGDLDVWSKDTSHDLAKKMIAAKYADNKPGCKVWQ